jgi:LacI family transcriptional regulator
MPPTIREVAERAGVSVSTVSRVLNEYPYVSEETRRRVLETMEELEYRPDVAARSMRTGTSRAVGLVFSDISNPLFSAMTKGADSVLHPKSYSLILANSANDPEHEAELMSALRQRRVDGLIAAVADERAPSLAARLAAFPATVLVDRRVTGSSADSVCSDHAAGMAQALEHLAELGHRRVALVAGSQGQLGSRARVVAFRKHAGRLGLAQDPRLVRTGELSRETGYLAARELLALDEPPTALIAGNNQLTVGVIRALRDLGLRMPDAVSLVACDDVDLTRLHDPPIDVIDRDALELGSTAAVLLLRRLENPDASPHRELLPTSFVRRASTGAVARSLAARRGSR